MAQNGGRTSGRAGPLCPTSPDINLFGYCQRVIDLNAEIADRALDLGVPEQELHGSQVAGAPIDQRRLRAPQRMRTEQRRIEPMLPIHSDTRRAYLACGYARPLCRRLANRSSPTFLPDVRK